MFYQVLSNEAEGHSMIRAIDNTSEDDLFEAEQLSQLKSWIKHKQN